MAEELKDNKEESKEESLHINSKEDLIAILTEIKNNQTEMKTIIDNLSNQEEKEESKEELKEEEKEENAEESQDEDLDEIEKMLSNI